MRGETTPRDLRVHQKISNGRAIKTDHPTRQNQAIEYDRGRLGLRRSYRGEPAFATEGVRAYARHSHLITPASANDGDWPTQLTSRHKITQGTVIATHATQATRRSCRGTPAFAIRRRKSARTAQALATQATRRTMAQLSRKPYPLRRVRFALRRVK